MQSAFLDLRDFSLEEALVLIHEILDKIEDTKPKLKKLLGDDDPICNRLRLIGVFTLNLSVAIETEKSGGDPVDYDDFTQS